MRQSVPLFILFLLLSVCFYGLHHSQPAYRFSVLMGGNTLLFLLASVSGYLVNKQIRERPHAFVRAVYSATFLKLFICMAGIVIYVLLNRSSLHKPTLFMLMGMYAVYAFAEAWILSRQARRANKPTT